jgi:FAD synthase
MVIYSWKDISDLHIKNSALTIGGFDGPHKGHESLFSAVLEYKKRTGYSAGIVTFSRSPGAIKKGNDFVGDISTINTKIDYFTEKGFDFCLVIDFSRDFGRMKGSDFLDILRNNCSMQFLAIGTDFRCGNNLDTGVAEISSYMVHYGLELAVCNPVLFNLERISSSAVRQAIVAGNLSYAIQLLGHPYVLDTSDYLWNEYIYKSSSSDTLRFISASKKGTQVFPPDGIYTVKVTLSDKRKNCSLPFVGTVSFITKLYAESNFLRLEVPTEHKMCLPQKIEFI